MLRKKIGSYIFIASSLLLVAGCNDSGDNGNGTSSSGDTESPGQSADTEYTIATVRWADWGEDFLQGFVAETEEEADININWDVYLNSDWGERKGVMMAGGELPDAFLGSITLNDSDVAQFSDSFLPLENLIQENMPNLVAAMEEDPNLEPLITSPDGHIYSLPTKLPLRPQAGNQLFINQQWLDNLGLDMPDTWEDFHDVLRAFNEEDANGNGDPNDEIPFGGGNADTVLSYLLPFGTSMSPGDREWLALVDGEPVYLPTADFYREGLQWMHEGYSEGLIDPEIFTQDTSMSDAKRQNAGDSLVGVAVGWTPDALFGPNAEEYVALPPLAGPDGERHVHSDAEVYSRNEFIITTQAENPERLLQWADLFYTEDASIQTFYGSFGVGVEKEDDGTYTVLEAPDGDADSFAWINSFRDFGPKYVSEGFNDKVTLPEDTGDGLKLRLDEEVNEYTTEQYPNVSFTAEELSRISTLGVDIGSYVTAMQAQWVVEGGVEEQWDTYMATLEQMGFDEFMQIQLDAFERFQENQ